MKRMFIAAVTTAALALFCTAASAGTYVATTFGYGSGSAHMSGGAIPSKLDASGIVASGEVGYVSNGSLYGVHVGALASFGDAAGLSGKTKTLECPAMYCGSDVFQVDDVSGGFVGTARGLVGTSLFGGKLFVAADGGAAYLQIADAQSYTDSPAWHYSADKSGIGYVVGARVLYNISSHWSAGVDYSHVSVDVGGAGYSGPGYHYYGGTTMSADLGSLVVAYNFN